MRQSGMGTIEMVVAAGMAGLVILGGYKLLGRFNQTDRKLEQSYDSIAYQQRFLQLMSCNGYLPGRSCTPGSDLSLASPHGNEVIAAAGTMFDGQQFTAVCGSDGISVNILRNGQPLYDSEMVPCPVRGSPGSSLPRIEGFYLQTYYLTPSPLCGSANPATGNCSCSSQSRSEVLIRIPNKTCWNNHYRRAGEPSSGCGIKLTSCIY